MKQTEDSLTAPMGSSERDEAGEALSQATTQPSSGSALPSEAPTIRIKQLPKQPAEKQRAPFSIGDRFVVEREIGRGGIGVTYLAIDTEDNNRAVAIKVLLERPEKDRAWIERHFRAEVAALSRINHPGVVRLVASGNTPEGEPYLAMEFVEGWDLRSQIEPEKGLRDFERTARIIRQLGEAINAAHDKGIYHRDLKPENIMIQCAEEGEQVKVIDFGIATVKESLDEKTKTTVLAGSVRYMAPEQIFGKPTGASDIYALGVIAYEMITGRVPFNPDLRHPLAAMQQLLEMQRNGVRVMPKDLRPSLPERAQEIVLKALDYQTGARYQRADEFGRELATALTEQDAEALAESYINRTIKRPGSRPHPATGLNASISAPGATEAGNLLSTTSRRLRITGAVVVLFFAVALSVFAWLYLKGRPNERGKTNGAIAARDRTLSYWVSAQKYKNQKADGEPIPLLGSEMYFNTGDGLRFFITSSDNGHLYLLSEEATRQSDQYNLLFPTPKANHSSSQIQANVEIATDENLFTGTTGVEKVWVVWSASPVVELENEIEKWKDKNYLGEIKDPSKVALITSFVEQNSKANLQVEQDEVNKRTRVKGTGDIMVRPLTLAHR